jgi:hypothetical protein
MKSKYIVKEETLTKEIMDFIITWHYSKSYRSLQQKFIFTLRDLNNNLIGVALYGKPMGKNIDSDKYIELRRFCLIDNTEKNTESFFLAKTLNILKNKDCPPIILSYTDPNVGHIGTIYKASNFKYVGEENNSNPRVVELNGKKIHLRQLYAKKDNQYTKTALKLQELIKNGVAKLLKQKRKLRFEYELRR